MVDYLNLKINQRLIFTRRQKSFHSDTKPGFHMLGYIHHLSHTTSFRDNIFWALGPNLSGLLKIKKRQLLLGDISKFHLLNSAYALELLIRIISKLVLVNGEPGEIIKHHRGLRQGDPLHKKGHDSYPIAFLEVIDKLQVHPNVTAILPTEVIVDFLIIWDLTQDIHLQPGVLQGSTMLKQPTNTSIFQDWWSMAEGLDIDVFHA
ncbi:hypothetical protein ACJX0J_032164, partial [Zea mays]